MLDKNYFKNLLPLRPKDAHKGTFGNVLNIAGSGFYTGAAYFSSAAALRVGCGKSTLGSVTQVLKAVSVLCPDVILMPLDESIHNTILPCAYTRIENHLDKFQVVSVGCGLYTCKDTVQFFEKLINVLCKTQLPVVIDADGLNILSILYSEEMVIDPETGTPFKPAKIELPIKKTPPTPMCLPVNTILTPHPTELAKLMAVSVENILLQPDFWVKKAAEKYNCTVVLKMHETMVADNKGNFYVNHTGNTALSHAGSGDVLCGMISGLLGQGANDLTSAKKTSKDCKRLDCFEASVLGVYLHGVAAELASKELSEYSVLSSDLLGYIPKAIKTLL